MRKFGIGYIGAMARLACAGICLSVVAARAAAPSLPTPPADAAAPEDNSNPYAIIVERNIFHLNPPPPPPEPEKPKVELPDVKITGFLNISGKWRVLFVAKSKDKKDPIYYSLTEGDASSDGHLKLLKINGTHDSVDVLNDGTAATLSVKTDSMAPNVAAAAPGPPQPGGAPAVANPVPNNPAAGIPGRQLFMPGRPGRGPNGSPFGFPGSRRQNLPN